MQSLSPKWQFSAEGGRKLGQSGEFGLSGLEPFASNARIVIAPKGLHS